MDIKFQTNEAKNNNSVKIIVSDTGIGIPPEKIKTLFETTFERGEEAKKWPL